MYKKFTISADVIVVKRGKILLVKRGIEPFIGKLCFPGGHSEGNETLEETAIRECKEETGIDIKVNKLLGVYSKPDRDPRGFNPSTVFICEYLDGEPKGGDDASEAMWVDIDFIEEMGFDHMKILEDYKRLND